jgi:outer membrane protein OmpA-like peptidoglycan-associated protein
MNKLGKLTRFLVRIALATVCVMPLVSLSLQAQSTPAATNSGVIYNSRFDFATLYSYFQAHGADTDVGISYNNIRLGAYASGSYYFNRHLGLEAAFEAHPDGNNDGLFDIEAGPIVRDNMNHFSLFAHGLIGVVDLAGPNTRICCNIGYQYHNPWTWGGPSYTAGGGLDWNITKPLSLRLFQVDYTYNNVSFGTPASSIRNAFPLGGRAHLPGLQASAGLVWHAGNITPPMPVSYSCSVSPSVVFPGDPITVTGVAMNLNPNRTATYTWTSTAGPVSGNSSTVTVNNITPGSYTVNGHVTEGSRAGQSADCTASYTVRGFAPPTISCSASPSTLNPGDKSAITAAGVSPQNRPLTYNYSAASGTISGAGASATFDSTGAATGAVGITCNVMDDKGQTATANTGVTIAQPPPPPPPPPPPAPAAEQVRLEARLALHSVFFPTALPRAEKPEGGLVDSQQATLTTLATDFKSYLTYKPDAHLTLTGHTDVRASVEYNQALSERRVARTKQFLVEQGVPEANIETRGLGKEEELSADQVKELVEQNPDLSDAERAKVLHNLNVIVLAQNRRVDVTLSTTGQQSVRLYPFNAADAMTLIQEESQATRKKAVAAKK